MYSGAPTELATVTVEPGQTRHVEVTLDWDPKGPWRDWTTGVLVGREYPPHLPALDEWGGAMAILPTDASLRLFWSHEDDIWSATSADGRTFSPPQRLRGT